MRARVVIGANFGDEGKGVVVDHLCSQGAGVVVRFNGGAQAGHTVVTPNEIRHVFHHIGSGAFLGVPTFLSQFFVINPILFLNELNVLRRLNVRPEVYAHPSCIVTTFADMIINQGLEDLRGTKRHGSVGVGVNETIERSDVPELRLTMSDLWNQAGRVERVVAEICERWARFRGGAPIIEPEMERAFVKACWATAEMIRPAGIAQCNDPVFEGAQGLLLDQNNKEFFPHLTRSNTGMQNVRELCRQANITEDDIEMYYVSRTYLTRHGAGPLPGEDPKLRFPDTTNLDHPYQGPLRFAALDAASLAERCGRDATRKFRAVFTHCDQLAAPCRADLYFHGPTRADVESDASIKKFAVAGEI